MDHTEPRSPNDIHLLKINRAEMPKSVLLSLALEHEQVRRRILKQLGIDDPLPNFQTTSLFHAVRDIVNHCAKNRRPQPFSDETELLLRELDVILLLPKFAVIAFELKWYAPTRRLEVQLREQHKILEALKTFYQCEFCKLCLVNATGISFGADHTLKFSELNDIIRSAFGGSNDPAHQRIVAEFGHLAATRQTPERVWRSISLTELLKLDDNPNTFVGYGKGLCELRKQTAIQIKQRPFWNVSEDGNPNPGHWFPLQTVQAEIEKILANAASGIGQ